MIERHVFPFQEIEVAVDYILDVASQINDGQFGRNYKQPWTIALDLSDKSEGQRTHALFRMVASYLFVQDICPDRSFERYLRLMKTSGRCNYPVDIHLANNPPVTNLNRSEQR